MSPRSHAVNRLRKVYRIVLAHMRAVIADLRNPLQAAAVPTAQEGGVFAAKLRGPAAAIGASVPSQAPAMDPLERRLMLDGVPGTEPVLVIPGFGGTLPADTSAAGLQEWLTTRGIAPDKLQTEPVGNVYADLIQTLQNVGYVQGQTLFVANWDWRVPVAPTDGATDGYLENLAAADVVDATYETGVDYLGHWLKQAADAWALLHPGEALESVDVIAHSTGGLVARSYVQSAAYGGEYQAGSYLPKLDDLVLVGVPNEGAGEVWSLLHNDFDGSGASQALAVLVDRAWDLVQDGGAIHGPDYDITVAGDPEAFLAQYVASGRDLLPTFDFVDSDGDGIFEPIPPAEGNHLLADLNSGFDAEAFLGEVTGNLTGVFSAGEETVTGVQRHTGPGAVGTVQNFDEWVGHVPEDGEVWYEEIETANSGDGTVTRQSAVGLFDPASGVVLAEQTGVGHPDLVSDLEAQKAILDAVGVTGYADADISVGSGNEVTAPLMRFFTEGTETLDSLGDGLEEFFGGLQDGFNDMFTRLPVIGPAFIEGGQFFGDFAGELAALLGDPIDLASGLVQAAQEDLFEAFDPYVRDSNGDGLVNADDIRIALVDDALEFGVHLGGEIASAELGLDLDVGLDALGLELEIDGGVELSVEWDLNLGFGTLLGESLSDGFFLDASDGNEAELIAEAALADGTTLFGRLAVLEVEATDIVDEDDIDDPADPNDTPNPEGRTGLFGSIGIDLREPAFYIDPAAGDGRLTLAEMREMPVRKMVAGTVDAGADVNLHARVDFGSDRFPSVETDFDLDWDFLSVDTSGGGDGDDEGMLSGERPVVAFNNVTLGLGSFISDFVGPILQDIQDVTRPVEPIIDILTMEIPVISDLAGPTSLLDLAEKLSPGLFNPAYIDAVKTVVGLVDMLNGLDLGGDIRVSFGDFVLSGVDFRQSDARLSDSQTTFFAFDLETQLDQQQTPGRTRNFIASLDGGGFEIPLLSDPSAVFQLLIGNTVDLFRYEMPALQIDFGYEATFYIFPGLSVKLGGHVGAEIHLGFGFDTYGIQQFADPDSPSYQDPAVIFDGFYANDHVGPGGDADEMSFSAGIEGKAVVGIPHILDVGAGGGVYANVGFDLNDLDGDGKVRGSEFADLVQLGPEYLFNMHGKVWAGLFAYIWVGLDLGWFGKITFWEDRYDIWSTTIADFDFNPLDPPPKIATLQADGTLVLNSGPAADWRLSGVEDEKFSVKLIEEDGVDKIVVLSAGYREEFDPSAVTSIYADGGTGDDELLIGEGIDVPVLLRGGQGDDRLRVLGSGPAVLYGEADNDVLVAGGGDDHLYGGGGDDQLDGGAGNDHLEGGEGNDRIVGAAGDDQLFGGTGDDRLDGGDGVDTLVGGAGSDLFFWAIGSGADTFVEADPPAPGDIDQITLVGGKELIGGGRRYRRFRQTDDEVWLGAQDGTVVIAAVTPDGTSSIQVDEIERISVVPGGGSDKVTVSDLRGTSVERIAVDLGQGNGSAGDTVSYHGTDGADTIRVEGALETAGQEVLTDSQGNFIGLGDAAQEKVLRVVHSTGGSDQVVYIQGSSPDSDRLEVLTLGGKDVLVLGAGDDGVRVQDLVTATLDGGAGDDTLTTTYSNVTAVGGDGQDFLRITADPNTGGSPEIRFDDTNVVVFRGGALEHLMAYEGVEGLQLDLGVEDGGNQVFVLDTPPVPVGIHGSAGADAVTLRGTGGPLSMDGGGGDDDRLTLDRSDRTNSVIGMVTTDRIDGFGLAEPIAYAGFEKVTIELGDGADALTIDGTSGDTTVNGRGGDDVFTVRAVGGTTEIRGGDAGEAYGQDDVDEVILEVPDDPNALNASPFAGLGFAVEMLCVDHVGSAPTDWLVEDGAVWVQRTPQQPLWLVDVPGAGLLTINGGAGGSDTLTIADNAPDPQRINLEPGTVWVQHGTELVWWEDPADFLADPAGARLAGPSPDGRYVHVLSGPSGEDSALQVYRRQEGTGDLDLAQEFDQAWLQQAKLITSDAARYDYVGLVATDRNAAIVGVSSRGDRYSFGGGAYIFEMRDTGWQEVAKLPLPDTVYIVGEGLEWRAYPWTFTPDILLGEVNSGTVRAMDDFHEYYGPAAGVYDYFFIRYTGQIYVDTPTSTPVTFYLSSDDGSRLYIDGSKVVDHWGGHGYSTKSNTVSLTPGLHSIQVDYYEQTQWAGLNLSYATPGQEPRTLDSQAWMHFGDSVDISGDFAVVGAPGDHAGGWYSGAAHFYERDSQGNWDYVDSISGRRGGREAGHSVGITGDMALVGEPASYLDAGQVYVCRKIAPNNWDVVQTIVPPDSEIYDGFGNRLAVDDNTAIILNRPQSGGEYKAYVYEYKPTGSGGWSWQWGQTLHASVDMSATSIYEVSLDGDTAAFRVYTGQEHQHVIFERDLLGQWVGKQEIPGNFWDVSIDGDRMLLGRGDSVQDVNSGAVHVYERNAAGTWEPITRFSPDEGGQNHAFGGSVALRGDTALVAAPGDDDAAENAGALYVYELTALIAGAESLAVSPDSQHVYVARPGRNAEVTNLALSGTATQSSAYPVNLALNGTASQSSTYGSYNASRATDGNTDGTMGQGSVSCTASEANSWWQVHLGDRSALDRVVLYNRADCCGRRLSNFRVSVFDGQTEVFRQDCFTQAGTGVPQGGSFAVSLPAGTAGDRVRVQLLGYNNDGNGYLSLAEVQVFDDGSAWRAIDGNADGAWSGGSVTHTQNDFQNAWWQVDLGDRYELTQIVLHNRSEYPHRLANFRVSVFDGATEVFGQDYFTGGGYVPVSGGLAIDLPAQTIGSRVLVRLLGPNPNVPTDGYLSLAEVEVSGYGDHRHAVSVFSRGGPAVNVARLGAAGSSGGSSDPYIAIDGITEGISNCFISASGNAWWQVQLADDCELTQIVVYQAEGYDPGWLSNFRLSVFRGDTEVYGQDFFVDSGGVVGTLTVDLPMDTVGDRVRILQRGRNSLNGYRFILAELEAYASPLTYVQELWDPSSLLGAHSVEVSPDGALAYVATDNEAVRTYTVDPTDGSLTFLASLSTAGAGRPVAIETTSDSHYAYLACDGGKIVTFHRDGLTHTRLPAEADVSGPSFLALSPDEAVLYAARRRDNAISVLARNAGTGELSFVEEIRNGQQGTRGLSGVAALSVTDEHVFAVASDDDSLVVFRRDAEGRLAFVQRLRNRSGGVQGLESPNTIAMSPDGSHLYVSSTGQGPAAPGGVAWYPIDYTAQPAPPLVVNHAGIELLTVRSGDKDDVVTVRGVGVPLVLETQGGWDDVVVQDVADNTALTVRLGDGSDVFDLRGTGEGVSVHVFGQEGEDAVGIWATGPGSTTQADAGTGDDSFYVDGDTLAGPVTVIGGDPAAPLSPGESGDRLEFAGTPDDLVPPLPDGDVTMGGTLAVSYSGLEAVSLLTARPQADAGGPYTLVEGQSLQLTASASVVPVGQTERAVEWDVDGDGAFGDLTGREPDDLLWDHLAAFGMDDDGRYQVAVRVTTDVTSDVAFATVVIANTPPDLTLAGEGEVDQYEPYALHLASSDPGEDTIAEWSVDWGDGVIERVLSNPPTVTHTYASPGVYAISATATDEDGTYPAGNAVTVEVADVPPVQNLTGPDTIDEGAQYTLGLHAARAAGNVTWIIDWGDGTPRQTAGGATASVHHTFADDSTHAEGGSFRIQATILDADGIYTATKLVTVLNVAPTLRIAGPASITEGEEYTLLLQAADPGRDSLSSWTIDWGDGAVQLVGSEVKSVTHVYADDSNAAQGAVYEIRATAVDEDATEDDPYEVSQVVAMDPDRPIFCFDSGFNATGHYYLLTSQAGDWGNAAWLEGQRLGGYPATVTSADEQRFLDRRFFDRAQPPERLWIDIIYLAQDRWYSTQEPLVYENWLPGQPDPGLWYAFVTLARQADPGPGEPLSRWDVRNSGESWFAIIELPSLDRIFALMGEQGDVLPVTVENVAPRADLSGAEEIDEGGLFTLAIDPPSDPGDDAVSHYRIDWGDGTTEMIEAPAAQAAGFVPRYSISHVYPDGDAVHNVTVGLIDEDGEHPAVSTHVLQVNNVPPAVDAGPDRVVHEGDPFTRIGSFSDPGADTWSATVDYGDGTGTQPLLLNPDKTFELDHVYGDDGVFTLIVTVEDDDGGVETATVTVTVNPVNDLPEANDDSATTDEDTPINIDVLANDSDADGDPLTITLISSTDGTAVVNDGGTPANPADDTVDFTPDAGFVGTAEFTYSVNDGQADSDPATVTVKVGPEDLTAGMQITGEGFRYDRQTGQYSGWIRIKNVSGNSFRAPIRMAIADLSDASISVLNADAGTADGMATFDLAPYLTGQTFDPGESVGPAPVRFANPNGLRFTFETLVLGMPVAGASGPSDAAVLAVANVAQAIPGQAPAPPGAVRILWTNVAPDATLSLYAFGPTGWSRSAENVPAEQGYFDWIPQGHAKGWYSFAAVADTTGSAFALDWVRLTDTPAEAPSAAGDPFGLVWLAPRQGDKVRLGETFEVTWQVTVPDGLDVQADLWAHEVDSGTWVPVAQGLDAMDGRFAWHTDSAQTGRYVFVILLNSDDLHIAVTGTSWLEVFTP